MRTPTRSSPPRAHGWWRSATPNGSGSSATCTTAHSSASCPWRCSSAWWRLGSVKTPAGARARRTPAQADLTRGLDELRELARGIHPAVLTERGLGPALDALAARAPVPVQLTAVPDERLAPPIEAAMYYVVAEAITNVAKYAHASGATVSIDRANGAARVTVADDGVGGADPSGGSGLSGLAARVEALNGRLDVASPPGGGTRITAEIPVT